MHDDANACMSMHREGAPTNSRRRAAICVRIWLLSENRHRTGLAGCPVDRTHADLSRSPSRFRPRDARRGARIAAHPVEPPESGTCVRTSARHLLQPPATSHEGGGWPGTPERLTVMTQWLQWSAKLRIRPRRGAGRHGLPDMMASTGPVEQARFCYGWRFSTHQI